MILQRVFPISAIVLIITALVSSALFYLLKIDILETIYMGQVFSWSYLKHPPLSFWFAGRLLNLPQELILPAATFILYGIYLMITWISYQFSQTIFNNEQLSRFVAFSTFVSLYIKHIDFTPDIAIVLISSLTFLYFYRAFKWNKTSDWALLTVLMIACVLAKYQTLIMFAAMGIGVLCSKLGRERLFSQKALVAILVFTAAIGLFAYYLFTAQSSSLGYAAAVLGTFKFGGTFTRPLAVAFVPILFCLVFFAKPLFKESYQHSKSWIKEGSFEVRFLLFNTIAFFLIWLALCFLFDRRLQTRFMMQNIIVFNLLFCWLLWPSIRTLISNSKKINYFGFTLIGLMMLIRLGDQIHDNNWQAFSEFDKVVAEIHKHTKQPVDVIVQTRRSFDQMYLNFDEQPEVVRADSISTDDLMKKLHSASFILLWESDSGMPEWVTPIQKAFPNLQISDVIHKESPTKSWMGIPLNPHKQNIQFAYLPPSR